MTANNLTELRELIERLKQEAPKVERDETATCLTLDEYYEWKKAQEAQA
jgi:hypothetical protein